MQFLLYRVDVYLNFIVHKRGCGVNEEYDNILAVEMKKQGSDFTSDKERLQMLVNDENGFGYRAGFAIVIIADNVLDRYELAIDVHGEFNNSVNSRDLNYPFCLN